MLRNASNFKTHYVFCLINHSIQRLAPSTDRVRYDFLLEIGTVRAMDKKKRKLYRVVLLHIGKRKDFLEALHFEGGYIKGSSISWVDLQS